MKSKKGMNKLFILFAVLLTLAMLIPAAAVSAADPLNPAATLTPDPAHNVAGSAETFTVAGMVTGNVTSFSVTGVPAAPSIVSQTLTADGNGSSITVNYSFVGEASIVANLSTNGTLSAVKKWGEISSSSITDPQDVVVVWYEGGSPSEPYVPAKSFYATTNVTDIIYADYLKKNEQTEQYTDVETFAANGAVLTWYLLADNPTNQAIAAAAAQMYPPLYQGDPRFSAVASATKATFATFGAIGQPVVSTMTTTSGDAGTDGTSTVTINSNGEEPVLVVVLVNYPISTQYPIFAEYTKVNFYTSEMEKVPQVRWAGEKIVLEKYFTPTYAGNLVRFSLENQSPGALEGLQGTQLGNLNNTNDTVWDVVSTTGWARCMLVSEDQGEVDVDLALYNTQDSAGVPGDSKIINQHGFVVFYMKLESITLGNVEGKRASHNAGPFEPSNPVWDYGTNLNPIASPDGVTGTLNVSADTLLRARVKGWFEGDNMSSRPALVQDADPTHPGSYLYTLPAGRWVLPDDWPVLAGPNWMEQRIHWDIMNAPNDGKVVDPVSANGQGAYMWGSKLVAAAPVIGPFTPELEIPTATGYNPNLGNPPYRFGVTPLPGATAVIQYKTVVPNGALDWWDAPMPPAKITFQMLDAAVMTDVSGNRTINIGDAGFFKDAFKTDIYISAGDFTNPFYWQYIPANFEIPAFVNNGGYDWDSWNVAYGPYQFWKIINRPVNPKMPASRPVNNANYPSMVQVYSDNHGEAMVYLNGNFALNPGLFTFKGTDVPFGSTVGSTTVVASADYPYFRKHNQLISNIVTKTWTWGGMVLGPDFTVGTNGGVLAVGDYFDVDGVNGYSKDMMVWVWATDRDGMAAGVQNTEVTWTIGPSAAGIIVSGLTKNGVSHYNTTMENIDIENGFLSGTNGGLYNTPSGWVYKSWMRSPTDAEEDLFTKLYGSIIGADGKALDPKDFVVAAIDLFDPTNGPNKAGTGDVQVSAFLQSPDFGTLAYSWNVNFAVSHPLDDVSLAGDANLDGKVTMADVTAIERIILGLDSPCYQADANLNDSINMGDVVKTERIILGIK